MSAINSFSPGDTTTGSAIHELLSQSNHLSNNNPSLAGPGSNYGDLLAEFSAFADGTNMMSPDQFLLDRSTGHYSSSGSGETAFDDESYLKNNSASPANLKLEDAAMSNYDTPNSGYEYLNSGLSQSNLPGVTEFRKPRSNASDTGSNNGRSETRGWSSTQSNGFPTGSPNMPSGQSNQLAIAINSMDATTQSQLLAALLSQQSNSTSHSPPLERASRPFVSTSSIDQERPSLSSSARSRPASRTPSTQNSPRSFQQFTGNSLSPYQPNSVSNHHIAINTSLPPSQHPSPLHSPYQTTSMNQQYFPDQSQSFAPSPKHQLRLQHTHVQQQSFLPSPHSSNFSPKPFVPPSFGPPSQRSIDDRGGALSTEIDSDMGTLRGGSATGGSYATTVDDEEWRENDFMFSPLMSPVMTPHSAFSQVSSFPPSGSCAPPISHAGMNLISPAEIFSPLGSPAITPHVYHHEAINQYQNAPALPVWQQSPHLTGLVDQTKALGFESHSVHASPTGYHAQPSPNVIASTSNGDLSTSTGSGRRGAGSKKARPSPLLKPTPDGSLRRKKGVVGSGGMVGNDVGPHSRSGSVGGGSATTSPFLGSTHMVSSQRSSSNSKTTSPNDAESNTPSPVDLAMTYIQSYSTGPTSTSLSNSSTAPNLTGFMGPPPLPATSTSRRTSLTLPGGEWMNPLTPSTYMNLPTDLSSSGLSTGPFVVDLENRETSMTMATSNTTPNPTGTTTPRNSVVASKKRLSNVLPNPANEGGATYNLPVLASQGSSAKGKGRATTNSVPMTNAKKAGAAKPARSVKAKASDSKLSNSDISTIASASNSLSVDASSTQPTNGQGADVRRTSHKAAEQKRRDSLKMCFVELRRILPPLAQTLNEEDRRPGEGNVGGQRGGSVDPENPNKGVSKVALLRRSNEYVGILDERIARRDQAIDALRAALIEARSRNGDDTGDEVEGFDFDQLDKGEKAAGTMAYYENFENGEVTEDGGEDIEIKNKSVRKQVVKRRPNNNDGDFTPGGRGPAGGARRSSRRSITAVMTEDDTEDMDLEV